MHPGLTRITQDVRERLRDAGELPAPAAVADAAPAVARSERMGAGWLVGDDGIPHVFQFAEPE